MIVSSPVFSFVDFNGTPLDCKGNETELSLPVYDNFGIKFQFSVLDELIPTSAVLKVAICDTECEPIYNPNYEAIHICQRYTLNLSGAAIVDANFPIYIPVYTPAPYQPHIANGFYNKQDLITALSAAYDYAIPGLDFIDCCDSEVPNISDIPAQIHGAGTILDLQLSSFFSNAYVDFPTTSMDTYINVGQCFRYCIMNESNTVIGCSNLFNRIADPCYTTVFTFYNEENGNGFKYVVLEDGTVTANQIRLNVYFDKPTFEITENIFRQSNELLKRLSTNIKRIFVGNVGPLSDDQHLKLVTLLKSDYLQVLHLNKNINRRMCQVGDYTPEYPDIPNYVSSIASFGIVDFQFAFNNNNCGFNCGVEILDDCTSSISPGGNVSKYHIEFKIPTGDMPEGATTYTNSNFIGATDVEVYREGLIQYLTGDNYYTFNTSTGQITVFPPVSLNERFSIWAV